MFANGINECSSRGFDVTMNDAMSVDSCKGCKEGAKVVPYVTDSHAAIINLGVNMSAPRKTLVRSHTRKS